MRLSVILSTYQHPEWLRKTLWGYAHQTWMPLEVIVADDGSSWKTAEVIDRLRPLLPFPIIHVWHENLGFRKCKILNEAIRVASGDYLLFSDGDCIARSDFLETHCRLARKGRFLSGGTLRLPLRISQLADRGAIERGDPFRPRWLYSQGFPSISKLHLIAMHGRASALADRLTTTRPTFNGHNSSVWKEDLLRVNGFDERMEYGGLDRELGQRLTNAGTLGKQVRHQAICVHLEHDRQYIDPEKVSRNRQLRSETARSKSTWTEFGVQQTTDAQPQEMLTFPSDLRFGTAPFPVIPARRDQKTAA